MSRPDHRVASRRSSEPRARDGAARRAFGTTAFVAASLLVLALAIAFDLRGQTLADDAAFSPFVASNGTIHLPRDFRANWYHLGTWVVVDPKAPGPGFHDVYTQPDTVESYRKTGRFPDGAVLVKEIRKIEYAPLTTGPANWPGEIDHWFVMIKDSQNRFPENPNWGNDWGWGLFYPKDPSLNTSKDHRSDCMGCHIPAQQTDWVYIQGYPTLLKETFQ